MSQNSVSNVGQNIEEEFEKVYDFDFHNFKRPYFVDQLETFNKIRKMQKQKRREELGLTSDSDFDSKKLKSGSQSDESDEDDDSFDYELNENERFANHMKEVELKNHN